MNWIFLFLFFCVTLCYELWSDVTNARKGKNDNHKTDTILREVVLAFGAWFSSEGSLVQAVNVFAMTNLVYWVVFDALFNLAQRQSLFYTGDGIKDSTLDRIFSEKPVFFFFFKVGLILITSVALFTPIASYFIIFWSFFSALLVALWLSPDLRFQLLRYKFAPTSIVVGILSFVSGIIVSDQGMGDLWVVLTMALPFTVVVVLSNIYYRVWET